MRIIVLGGIAVLLLLVVGFSKKPEAPSLARLADRVEQLDAIPADTRSELTRLIEGGIWGERLDRRAHDPGLSDPTSSPTIDDGRSVLFLSSRNAHSRHAFASERSVSLCSDGPLRAIRSHSSAYLRYSSGLCIACHPWLSLVWESQPPPSAKVPFPFFGSSGSEHKLASRVAFIDQDGDRNGSWR